MQLKLNRTLYCKYINQKLKINNKKLKQMLIEKEITINPLRYKIINKILNNRNH